MLHVTCYMLHKEMRLLKNIYHLFCALLANIIYRFPSRRLKVIGVTGTDGKTTTTHLIYHILKTAGKKVSMVSTVYAKIGDKEYDTGLHTTTPDSFLIQKLLRDSARYHDEYFVLETTSHALDQYRVWGVKYEIGVLTNVSHEHLDYHKSYENYVKTKAKLLLSSNIPIVNIDDRSFEIINKILRSQEKKYYVYGFNHKSDFSFPYLKKISGFNKYNYLAGYSVASIVNISDRTVEKAIASFKLPSGRLEIVYNKEFMVIIDFAHTPNAFAQLLPYIQKQYLKKAGRIIHVFGAAGKRDVSKRPLMGEKSSQFSDHIILTEEDHRSEDPQKIALEISAGIVDKNIYEIITDRKLAIEKAIIMAKKNDVVLLTGKSHEKSLCRGNKEYPWSEHEAVNQALLLKN